MTAAVVGSGVDASGSGCHPNHVGGEPSGLEAHVANDSTTLDCPLPAPVSQSFTLACSGEQPGAVFCTWGSVRGTTRGHLSQNHGSFVPGTFGMVCSQNEKSA